MRERHQKAKTIRRMDKLHVEETFLPPDEYPPLDILLTMKDAPPFEDFPDGMYILGTKGFTRLIGYSATSQIDAYIRDQEMAANSVNN